MNKSIPIVIGVIVVSIAGTGVFFAVRQPKQMPNSVQESVQQGGGFPTGTKEKPPMPSEGSSPGVKKPPMPTGARGLNIPEGSQPIFGTVSNLEGSSFSIKSPMGESKVIFTASTTFEGGSSSDLKNDVRVGGYGTKNADGTITALQIQINPSMPDRGQFPSRTN